MTQRRFSICALVALAATLVAIYIYPYLPDRQLNLTPEDAVRFLYADDEKPGNDSWLDAENDQFGCTRGPDSQMQHCGMHWIYTDDLNQGLDLSGYRTIDIDIDYHGSAELIRIFLRHYDVRYSVPDDANSAKFISVNVQPHEFDGNLSIGLDEFRVADWWVRQYNLPRQFSMPQFSNIIALGVDFGSEIPPGDHIFDIQRINAVGPWIAEKDWYLGILSFWITALLGILTQQWWMLYRRSKADRLYIHALASKNISLHTKSEQYRELSTIDPLTGIANRRGLEKAVNSSVEAASQYEVVLILLDLDHFKKVNDEHGHNAGDKVLTQVASLIVANTRGSDHVGRWGGEEFIIFCSQANLENGYAFAEKIRRAIGAANIEAGGEFVRVTASLGVTSIKPKENFTDAFQRADQALYRAKQEGRNRTIIVY